MKGLAFAAHKIQTEFGVKWVVLSDGKDGIVVAGPDSMAHGKSELSAEATAKIVNDQVHLSFVLAWALTGASLPCPSFLYAYPANATRH